MWRELAPDDAVAEVLSWDWAFWARPEQFPPPGRWHTWLVMAGRGFGKTRCGAEWVRSRVAAGALRVGLVARTPADARDVMVEGPDGILAVSTPDERPIYEPSKRRLTWPSGCVGTTYSAQEPKQLRGPQHDTVWGDEIAAWRYGKEAWENATIGCRYGDDPRLCATTTPRPIPLIKTLLKRANLPVLDPAGRPTDVIDVRVSHGTVYDNLENLADSYINAVVRPLEGTRLGQQELMGKLLDDVPGALWTRALLERTRVLPDAVPDLRFIIVGVDPGGDGDEDAATGIVTAGSVAGQQRGLPHCYVLSDSTISGKPEVWARAVVDAYKANEADLIVAEKNHGGDMVETVIHQIDPKVPVELVWASRGKRPRAEPVATAQEQGRVHHVGLFAELEDEMCTFVPGDPSPHHMDAAVWALTKLLEGGAGPRGTPWTTIAGKTQAGLRRTAWMMNIGSEGGRDE